VANLSWILATIRCDVDISVSYRATIARPFQMGTCSRYLKDEV